LSLGFFSEFPPKLHTTDEIFCDLKREPLRKKKILLPYIRNDDPYFTYRELERILFKK